MIVGTALGTLYAQTGNQAKAEQAFRQALALDPQFQTAQRNLQQLTGTSVTTQTQNTSAPRPNTAVPPTQPTKRRGIAIVTDQRGAQVKVHAERLRFEYYDAGLKLLNGLEVSFQLMKSFEIVQVTETTRTDNCSPGFTEYDVKVVITLLDGNAVTELLDCVNEIAGLIGESDLGDLDLDFIKVKRVDFEWQ